MNITEKLLSFFTPTGQQLIEKYNRLIGDGDLPYSDRLAVFRQYKSPKELQRFIYKMLMDTEARGPLQVNCIIHYFKNWLTFIGMAISEQDKKYAQDCLLILNTLSWRDGPLLEKEWEYASVIIIAEAEATEATIAVIIINYLADQGYPDTPERDLLISRIAIDEDVMNRTDISMQVLQWMEQDAPGNIPRLDQARPFMHNPEIWGRPHTADLPTSRSCVPDYGGASSSSSSTRAGAARYLGARRREEIKRMSPYSAQWAQVHKKYPLAKKLVHVPGHRLYRHIVYRA